MSVTDSTKWDQAAVNMVAHPMLSVKDAMKLADFSVDKRDDKTLQKKSSDACLARGSVT
jgi:hypothetical protein